MFDRHYKLYSRILIAADAFVAIPALYLAYNIRYYVVKFAPQEFSDRFNPILLPFSDYFQYLLIFLPVWFIFLVATQRYDVALRQPLSRQLKRILYFLLLAGLVMGFVTFSLKLEVSRPIFFTFFAFNFVALPLNRVALYWVLRSRNISAHSQIRILIVGTDERARRVARRLADARRWGYRVIGHIRMNGDGHGIESSDILGSMEDLPHLLQSDVVPDEIIFSGFPKKELEAYDDVLGLCEELGIRTRIAADLVPVEASSVSLEFLDNLPLISFSKAPEHGFALVLKRVIDFLVALVGLVLLAPFLALVALAIKFTSPGPIFYRQDRCGLYGRRFELIKFRTMVEGAEDKLWEIRHLNEMDGPVFKMRNDPRVTALGRFLRKSSIDELPQLWNVIKGEMSIVGPRAPLVEEVRHYSLAQRRRLSVRPGITCLWQVSGRSDISFQTWMDMDLEYIDNWSVWLDLRIMLKTIPAVFTGRGAR